MKIIGALFCLFACCFSGCLKKNTPPPVASQTLHLNLSDDPTSLDPRRVRSLRDLTLVKQLFDGLMRLDATGNPQPALASTVIISEDKLTYMFKLRSAFWTNGRPVIASDFVSAWTKALDPAFASDYAHMFYPIKNAKAFRDGKCPMSEVGIKAPDPKTLIVTLEHPTPYFLELTAFPTLFPVDAATDSLDKNWSRPPGHCFVSNGPFHIKKWSPQSELILEKNPTYWEANAVHLNGLAFTIITDSTTEGHLFEKGQLDWLGQPVSNNISPELLEKMKEQGKVLSYPVAGTFWFKFNTTQPPFNNALIRKAFSLAIKRNEIIAHLLQGGQQIATGILPPCIALQETPYFSDGDLEAAKYAFEKGMEQEGWTLQTFPAVALTFPPTERNKKIVELVQEQWQKAFGLPISLESAERHYYGRLLAEGKFQIGTGDWIADFNDPMAFLEIFKYRKDEASGSGMNDTGWHDDRYTMYLDQALTQTDIKQRKALLHAAETILIESMPVAPVYHYSFDYAKQEGLEDVVLLPLGIADFKYAKWIPSKDAISHR